MLLPTHTSASMAFGPTSRRRRLVSRTERVGTSAVLLFIRGGMKTYCPLLWRPYSLFLGTEACDKHPCCGAPPGVRPGRCVANAERLAGG